MDGSGPEAETVISSRVRIARNIRGIPFPYLASDAQTRHVQEIVAGVAASQKKAFQKCAFIPMENLVSLEKELLVEKHLVSPFLARDSQHGALLLRQDEAVSIMINEEDHLRIQVILPGLQLEEALEEADRYDDFLEAEINYAYDENYGYLTACPTNVGTGLRASVMLHLPALIMTGQANRLLGALSQVGLAVRGLYGEGTEIIGNLVQISNQITLGQSEEEIIRNLDGVTRQVIEQEQAARQALLNKNRAQIGDRSWRSLGQLKFAQLMSSQEAMQLLSDVRLGYDLGLLKGITRKLLNEMMVVNSPACLQILAEKELTPAERDLERPVQLKKIMEQFKESG
ncbi:MAG: protein arginine kinase [Firmicutes bacterium]|nr:protein arginine kinase [Bacillota bacterium]